MKIYTKSGDEGWTGLPGGRKLRKDDSVFDALGDLDELNSGLGHCAAATLTPLTARRVTGLQHLIFAAGAELARGREDHGWGKEAFILEAEIDAMTSQLPPIEFFILPGGCEAAARIHLVRGICRRAERQLVRHDDALGHHPALRVFLNRMSDWLFCAARWENGAAGVADVRWESSATWNEA